MMRKGMTAPGPTIHFHCWSGAGAVNPFPFLILLFLPLFLSHSIVSEAEGCQRLMRKEDEEGGQGRESDSRGTAIERKENVGCSMGITSLHFVLLVFPSLVARARQ